jgi:hypothetical protein
VGAWIAGRTGAGISAEYAEELIAEIREGRDSR